MAHTIDESSTASNPGKISISPGKFLDYMEVKGIKKFIYSLLLKSSVDYLHNNFRMLGLVSEWIQKCEHFELGCINPSVVLNAEEGLIATFTNLTNDGSNDIKPVIKISYEKLHLIRNKAIKDGQRISSVALYYPQSAVSNLNYWRDFQPLVPNCFTDDITSCDYTFNRITKNAWKCLELGLEQIESREEGLYFVDLKKDLVINAY